MRFDVLYLAAWIIAGVAALSLAGFVIVAAASAWEALSKRAPGWRRWPALLGACALASLFGWAFWDPAVAWLTRTAVALRILQ